MNKPAHHRQNLAHQAAREHKVNRNLSPSFARIKAKASQTPPEARLPAIEENLGVGNTRHTNEPRRTTPPPARINHTATEHTAREENIRPATPLVSPHQANRPHNPGINSIRITPWLIASITLTLALFSGNYAWHTQQDLQKLSLRFEQLEAQVVAPPVADLLDNSDIVAETKQELLSLSETQEQLATTVTTLQSSLETDAEQTTSRLTALEDTFTGLSLQMQEAIRRKEESKALIAQTTETETANSETVSDSKADGATDNSAAVNWFINIASFSDPNAASSIHEKAQKIADTASIKPITVNGKTLYRIRAEGYDSREDAEREAQALQTQLGLSGLWVSRD
ncbi:MAG: SPOR domain-containing protein [Candidatus Reddybacter sp.]